MKHKHKHLKVSIVSMSDTHPTLARFVHTTTYVSHKLGPNSEKPKNSKESVSALKKEKKN